jgi:preprotein translocase subunit SecB
MSGQTFDQVSSQTTEKRQEKAPQNIFNIQRIYVKGSSFEMQNAPEIFTKLQESQNEMELKLEHKKLSEDHYEVVLNIAMVTKIKSKKGEAEQKADQKEDTKDKGTEACCIKVKQAGIFQLKGFSDDDRKQLLGAYCPEILYPYARHTIAELALVGSLPPITLVPMNFKSLYEQSKKQAQQSKESSKSNGTYH